MNDDALRWLVELLVAVCGGGGVAYVLTLRQRKALLSAQASDTIATGQARILDAAGRIVENSADLVPQLLQRVTSLESAGEQRQAQLTAVSLELEDVHRFVDEAARWMGNAVRLISELGGSIAPPPDVPPRRPFPRTPTPAAAAQS